MIRVLVLFLSQAGWASVPVLVKDLRPDWMEYTHDHYQFLNTSDLSKLRAVYFRVNTPSIKGQFLSIVSEEEWTLFMNGRLIFSGWKHRFSLDSLSAVSDQELFFGIHSATGVWGLSTQIESWNLPMATVTAEITARPPTFFRDYCIVVSAFLLLFLLLLFRTNPQLALDYFSFAKIFSIQERNEDLIVSRIASSVNLLFYLYCALLTGFLLSAVFYLAGPFFLVSRFIQVNSIGSVFLLWLRLSLFILILLAAKLVIVLLFSSLFNFRETVSFQFFNFLRFVLFTAIVMAILSLIYFFFRGGQAIFYERLILLALTLLSVGSVMVLIKLAARASFSFFHLFSYLCVSEIIPLVIIIKIFF